MQAAEAKEKVLSAIESKGVGKRKINYKLRDWCISRQRYWGCPIPMVQCDSCGTVPEKKENLPVKLPDDVVFDGEGNPLEKSKSFVACSCPKCGKSARRVTDTMDTYVESAWYFLKQISNPQNEPFTKRDALDVMPVDLYLGGPEHATTHMLYARFFMKALRDCEYFGESEQIQQANWGNAFENIKSCEPFKKFIATGMVCHEAYQDAKGNYFYPEEVKVSEDGAVNRKTGEVLKIISGIKMSKSKKNTIQPSDIVERYGADVARFFLASDNPIDNDFDWKGTGIESVAKYVKKIFLFFTSNKENFYKSVEKNDMSVLSTNVYQFDDKKILKLFSQYLYSFERNEYNICIAKFREIMNIMFLSAGSGIFSSIFLIRDILRVISPIIPHFAEEVLERLEISELEKKYNLSNLFPAIENKMIAGELITMPIQVNGKVKIKLEVQENEEEAEIVSLACRKIGIAAANIKNIIYIKNKILNIII
jgi:leucyl-tRNA synthetase